jgi:hypothetical protein
MNGKGGGGKQKQVCVHQNELCLWKSTKPCNVTTELLGLSVFNASRIDSFAEARDPFLSQFSRIQFTEMYVPKTHYYSPISVFQLIVFQSLFSVKILHEFIFSLP